MVSCKERPFVNWIDFVARFLDDFEPYNGSDVLLEYIKNRVQKSEESIVKYFTEMEHLLPVVLSVYERLRILRKNILPSYIQSLALLDFKSTTELKDCCKKLELSNWMIQSRSNHSTTYFPNSVSNQQLNSSLQNRSNNNFNNTNKFVHPFPRPNSYSNYSRQFNQEPNRVAQNYLKPTYDSNRWNNNQKQRGRLVGNNNYVNRNPNCVGAGINNNS